jgi:hypothetical protein
MPQLNLGALRAVADRLDGLGLDYAFLGGAVVALLLDNPELWPVRPTDDVDVILEVATTHRYSDVEARLRGLGFQHDMREGAPKCRWVLGSLTVDIMPTDGAHLGLNTAWFKEALETAEVREFANNRFKIVSPVAFLATKHVAFIDRGRGDYRGSHDLEDFITVIDGRAKIVGEIKNASERIRDYVIEAVCQLIQEPSFNEAIPGHLEGDWASQQRLPSIREKLRGIATLA